MNKIQAMNILELDSLPPNSAEAIKVIKGRYKELAHIHHPDKGDNEQLFKKLNKQYE